ncbi:MAG: glycoside hydrolase family 75 protein [Dongiaceae bacterium]
MQSRKIVVLAAAIMLALHGAPVLAESDCGERAAFSVGIMPVKKLADGALKFQRPLAINIDGAPNAYHIKGRPFGALDTLCNAGRAISSARGTYEGSTRCGDFLKDVAAARKNGWHGDPRIEWYGLATVDRTRNEPVVQDDGPYEGYFVSTTSFQNTAFDLGDPRRYLDSRTVPFIVLPGRSPFFVRAGVALGNVAFVIDPNSGHEAFAIVGDTGPARALGEGSIALAAAIRGKKIDPQTLTSKQVEALAIAEPIVTIVFPGTHVQPPYVRAQIDTAGAAAAEALGGMDRLRACAASPQS